VQLARDLTAQYEMMTAETIDLFIDREALSWGDKWRDKVDRSLATTAFFVAVLTPRYFVSSECRRELQTFVRGAEQLGLKDLVLPLVYVDIPDLHNDTTQDDAIGLVKTFQWVDWRNLRFADPTSVEYRSAVAGLAQRLVDANRKALSAEVEKEADVAPADSADGSPDSGEPGIIDLLAAGENALPEWADIISDFSREMENFNTLTVNATEEIGVADRANKGAAGRLVVARKLAKNLAEPAEHMLELANRYAAKSYDVDAAITMLISGAPEEVENNPDTKETACEFFDSVTTMAQSSREAVHGLEEMSQTLAAAENLSRDLKPPIQKVKKSIQILIEATAVIDGWAKTIEESPIDCSG